MTAGALPRFVRFWREMLASPRTVGAVAPSSAGLARRMTEWIDWNAPLRVVECGPGTGAFTGLIRQRLRPEARFVVVERSAAFADLLRSRYPGLTVIQDDALRLPEISRAVGLYPLDALLSSIPWASLPPAAQAPLLEAMSSCLRAGGWFATFAYVSGAMLPGARHFRRLLPQHFAEVRRSPVVWRNLPPAVVYRCRR